MQFVNIFDCQLEDLIFFNNDWTELDHGAEELTTDVEGEIGVFANHPADGSQFQADFDYFRDWESQISSVSASPSISPSASLSASPSRSASPSVSISASISASPSRSASPSVSVSASVSASPSRSASPSVSPSASVSASPSVSPSASPSASPSGVGWPYAYMADNELLWITVYEEEEL